MIIEDCKKITMLTVVRQRLSMPALKKEQSQSKWQNKYFEKKNPITYKTFTKHTVLNKILQSDTRSHSQ